MTSPTLDQYIARVRALRPDLMAKYDANPVYHHYRGTGTPEPSPDYGLIDTLADVLEDEAGIYGCEVCGDFHLLSDWTVHQ